MKKILRNLLIAFICMGTIKVHSAATGHYPLDSMEPNLKDKASLQRGLGTFMNYCYGCHATQFQRYERVADDLGISKETMEEYVIFNQSKIGDLMKSGALKRRSKSMVWSCTS